MMAVSKHNEISEMIVPLHKVASAQHHRQSSRTRHVVNGQAAPRPHYLLIAQFPNETGFYLIGTDANAVEITDTYHDTITSAFEQASFEFGIDSAEWQSLAIPQRT